MKFNPLTRGKKREENTQQDVFNILDAGYLCHIACIHANTPMMIPTAYGRKGDVLYIHGSTKNFIMTEAVKNDKVCISVTHLDGIVLAKTLFNTSINYRSVVLFGKAEWVTDEEERMEGLKIITDNIISGRWEEVVIGTESQLKATGVIKIKIEEATAKIRAVGPEGDEDIVAPDVWSGLIPLQTIARKPILDTKFGDNPPVSKSVEDFYQKYSS